MTFFRRVAEPIAAALRKPLIFTIAAVVFCGIAAWNAVSRLPGFVDDVPPISLNVRGDDWQRYKYYAIDILENGPAMRIVNEEYSVPGGFLYNYFVAGIFAVAGRNSTYVYVVQAVLVALGALLFYAGARRYLSPEAGLLFFLLAAFALYRGIYHYLSFRLLSENLAVPLIALSVITLLHAHEKDSLSLYVLTGVLLGAVVLTRPNLQLIPYFIAGIVLWYHRGPRRTGSGRAALLLACALLVIAVLAWRNYVVAGNFTTVAPRYGQILVPQAWKYGGTMGLLVVFAKRAVYNTGILIGGMNFSSGEVVLNKQILVGTIGALAQAGRALKLRRLELIDAVAIAWVLSSHITFTFIPALGAYGMRFQWLVAPMLFLLACRFLDAVLFRRLASSPVPAG